MSSTTPLIRGGNGRDDFPSPRWPVHRLLEAYQLPGGVWLEPCAGEGSIIKAVNEFRSDVIWLANEINPGCESSLLAIPNMHAVAVSDARQLTLACAPPAVIITNPPFMYAEEILERCLSIKSLTIFLKRIDWCTGPRAEIYRQLSPSLYALPNRPSFTDDGKTDSSDYAWHVFDGLGKFKVLKNTPAEVRRAEKEERRKKYIDLKISNIVKPSSDNEDYKRLPSDIRKAVEFGWPSACEAD